MLHSDVRLFFCLVVMMVFRVNQGDSSDGGLLVVVEVFCQWPRLQVVGGMDGSED